MKYLNPFLSFLFLFFFSVGLSISDEVDEPDFLIFSKYFQEEFPPKGWSLVSTNKEHTWEKVNSIEEVTFVNQLTRYPYFIYVGGPPGEVYDEILISPVFESEERGECRINVRMACISDFSYEDDFNLRLDINYYFGTDPSTTWETLLSIKGDTDNFYCEPNKDYWTENPTKAFTPTLAFQIRLRYSGTSGTGVAVAFVFSDCYKNREDTNNKKYTNNCGLTFHDPAAPLALLMVLVGCGALLISRRR